MKHYDGSAQRVLEIFDDYDGINIFFDDESLKNINSHLKEALSHFGRYLLSSLKSMAYIDIDGYVANEIVEIYGRKLNQQIFVINRVWNCDWEEYEDYEIMDALESLSKHYKNFLMYD